MKISEIINSLKKIEQEHGDINTSIDIRWYDNGTLRYDDDLMCIFNHDD